MIHFVDEQQNFHITAEQLADLVTYQQNNTRVILPWQRISNVLQQ